MRPQLLHADELLRETYDKAAISGADRGMLRDSVRQWSRWRRQANEDPQETLIRYQDMERRLRAATPVEHVAGF
jgi:uncharacterized protein